MLTGFSLFQSDIFRPIRTRLYFKMRPLVLSKGIELSLVTVWQAGTCSIAICLILSFHYSFQSYRVSLVFLCRTTYCVILGVSGKFQNTFVLKIFEGNLFLSHVLAQNETCNFLSMTSIIYQLIVPRKSDFVIKDNKFEVTGTNKLMN